MIRDAAFIALLLVGFGCFPSDSGDDPLANPNLDATLTTGSSDASQSGAGDSETGVLSISPGAVRLAPGGELDFTVAGGVGPYVFSLVSTPASGTLAPSGRYRAGAAPGSDRVRVVDATGARSDADVNIYDPARETAPYAIECTDFTPPQNRIVVPPGTRVHFRIRNGTAPDSFDVRALSGGTPDGFQLSSRTGTWRVGPTGADDGSVVDEIFVMDSSTPINVAALKIYVCATPLSVTPAEVMIGQSGLETFSAPQQGTGALSWDFARNESGGFLSPVTGPSSTYQAGGATGGVHGAVDVVEIRDSFSPIPQVAQARAILPGLTVLPREASVRPGSTATLVALGGSGHYTWTRTRNDSDGPTAPGSGASFVYVAGAGEGVDEIRLDDGTAGGAIEVRIAVCGAVTRRDFSLKGYEPSGGTLGCTTGGHMALDMVADDLDGDGIDDIACTHSGSGPSRISDFQGGQVSILSATAPGVFASSPATVTLPGDRPGPVGIAAGDFNADGRRDLAVACHRAGNVVVLFGDGTGAFPATANHPHLVVGLPDGAAPVGIVTYNFDRSGGDDLVVCDSALGRVFVLRSEGGGEGRPPRGFTIRAVLSLSDPVSTDGWTPKAMNAVVANFDNDASCASDRQGNTADGTGYADIAVTDYAHDRVVIFAGTGLFAWNESGQSAFPVRTNGWNVPTYRPYAIATGFFNGAGDTAPDIVVTHQNVAVRSRGISVLNNRGLTGSLAFDAPREFGHSCSLVRFWWDVVVADFDRDGADDIAATSLGCRQDFGYGAPSAQLSWQGLFVWRGGGDGSFTTYNQNTSSTWAVRYVAGTWAWNPSALAVIDAGGQTAGGAPMSDLAVLSASEVAGLPWYGKVTVYENLSR